MRVNRYVFGTLYRLTRGKRAGALPVGLIVAERLDPDKQHPYQMQSKANKREYEAELSHSERTNPLVQDLDVSPDTVQYHKHRRRGDEAEREREEVRAALQSDPGGNQQGDCDKARKNHEHDTREKF